MLFGNKLAVHITHMDAARRAVHGGTAFTQVFDNLLKRAGKEQNLAGA